ncbi:HAD-IIA family hydrolase [Paenibacillus rhizophilus]|uniref:HAD-IIA family hydrolase n=2 Tax=Paenibacillus rhizophilus TaxID=1850366 RepID=A0A3N9P1M8_9BACL|nr:HAD-IIA family hydrolase [Paenibacillus rhizophilus]
MGNTAMNSMKAFLFDLDGCIYYGDTPAAGAKELLELLRHEGKRCFFVTNNSTQTAKEIASKMSRIGIQAEPDEIVTVTDNAGHYLKGKFGGCVKVKVAGSEALQSSVLGVGHELIPIDSPAPADVILVGRDVTFDYDKLQMIVNDVHRGAKVVGANCDSHHVGTGGKIIPETGSLTAAIETMIGLKIEHIGKPSPYLFQSVLNRYGLDPDHCIMVGDNFMTDMAGGVQAGLRTVWINEHNPYLREDMLGIFPDYIVKNMEQLLNIYTK